MTDTAQMWQQWLATAGRIARTGMNGTENIYSIERYHHLAQLVAEMRDGPLTLPDTPQTFAMPGGVLAPKTDVRAAAFRDGKLLMVREATDDSWAMPGGWADPGDAPSLAAEREAAEESGFTVKARKLIGVFDCNRSGLPVSAFHAYKFVFLCEITGGSIEPAPEIADVRFFGPDEMPDLDGTERTQPRMFREAFAHYRDPTRPTWFD